jgi:DNA-binding response OmpR family regulator
MRLLIIEDDVEVAEALSDAFARRKIHCDLAHDAGDGEQMLRLTEYSAVILDLGLPDEDGMALLRRLRASGRSEPIIVLTARGDGPSRVEGLTHGADDYLAKPFLFEELEARIQAILRRQGGYVDRRISLANLHLDLITREVATDTGTVDFTARDTELIEILMRRAGHVVPKRILEDQLFGSGDALGSNAVEVYIHRLRKKFEAAHVRVKIQTVRGVGYFMVEA